MDIISFLAASVGEICGIIFVCLIIYGVLRYLLKKKDR
jgi:hypothetical protein